MMMMMCAISSIEVLHSSACRQVLWTLGAGSRPTLYIVHVIRNHDDPAEGHEHRHARECSYSVLPETCSDSFLPPILSR